MSFTEVDNSIVATLEDKKGEVLATFRYDPRPIQSGSGSGVTKGAYQMANEDYKSSRIVTPKTAVELNAEDLAEWQRKTLIEQATQAASKSRIDDGNDN